MYNRIGIVIEDGKVQDVFWFPNEDAERRYIVIDRDIQKVYPIWTSGPHPITPAPQSIFDDLDEEASLDVDPKYFDSKTLWIRCDPEGNKEVASPD